MTHHAPTGARARVLEDAILALAVAHGGVATLIGPLDDDTAATVRDAAERAQRRARALAAAERESAGVTR